MAMKPRIIFFAGKGGVGKSSVAGATGVLSAESGRKTLIMSLDVAHSLSDIFEVKGSGILDFNRGRPFQVRENLWIQELDITEEIEKNWGEIYRYISTLFNATGLDEVLAEELAILPGMEEVSLLLYINRYFREKRFDVIVLDCAPTGESIRFISIPTTLEWYIKKVFRIEKTIAKYARPIAKRVYDIELPGEKYFDAIEYLFERLRGVDELLTNPEITSVRLVTNPEKIVLKETQRAFMYFNLFKLNVDAIIVNRIIPSSIKDNYFSGWRQTQKQQLNFAEECFAPVPLFQVSLMKNEVLGYENLKALGKRIYRDKNPLKIFYTGKSYELKKKNGIYCISINLPFVDKKDLILNKVHDELIIRVGGTKRHFLLPRYLAGIESVSARFEGEKLYIFFKGGHDDQK